MTSDVNSSFRIFPFVVMHMIKLKIIIKRNGFVLFKMQINPDIKNFKIKIVKL